MIHPDTHLRFIGEEIGLGVFATNQILKGTIVYIEDGLEQVITPEEFDKFDDLIQKKIEMYSFREENGNRIVSWDHAKYVNHSCSCNTISTGYGFEIAISDIEPGEQITDEYGLFNLEHEMVCCCGCENCRKVIRPDDIDRYYHRWDEMIKGSLPKMYAVEQPLMCLMNGRVRKELDQYFDNPETYKSVYRLKYQQ